MGVIGAGYWGKKHVDEYSHLGHEIIVSDLSRENLEFCKLNYGTQTVSDYHEILDNDEIKTVSICTPNSTHHKIAIEALNVGKHVLLEKPIATNSQDAEEIIKLANSKNLVLLTGHIFRYNNSIKKIKELIMQKKLGRIYTVNISWTNLEPIFPDRDILFDLGIHPLDILDQIFEKNPTDIFCTGEGFRQRNAEFVIINYHLNDSFGWKDVFVNMELSWLNPIRNRKMIIVGSEKTAIVDCVIQKIQLINNQSGVSEDIPIVPNNAIRDELEYFLARSTKGLTPTHNEPNGVVGKRIVEFIEVSERSLKHTIP
ncbi:MAG: Gfo/Idh/MocA family protein [Nitrosopumilaceae archaeon]